jgi:hypothetical protein
MLGAGLCCIYGGLSKGTIFAVLCCAVVYCGVLCCAVLCCAVLCLGVC